jgi:hypothetical protein
MSDLAHRATVAAVRPSTLRVAPDATASPQVSLPCPLFAGATPKVGTPRTCAQNGDTPKTGTGNRIQLKSNQKGDRQQPERNRKGDGKSSPANRPSPPVLSEPLFFAFASTESAGKLSQPSRREAKQPPRSPGLGVSARNRRSGHTANPREVVSAPVEVGMSPFERARVRACPHWSPFTFFRAGPLVRPPLGPVPSSALL